MYAHDQVIVTLRLTLKFELQLCLKYYKNGKIISHRNGSPDRFSAGLAINKQDVSLFLQYSFQTGFRPCLYEDIRPRMWSSQLQASENFSSRFDYVKINTEWI